MPPPKKVKAKINANHPILNYGTSILMKDLKILSKKSFILISNFVTVFIK